MTRPSATQPDRNDLPDNVWDSLPAQIAIIDEHGSVVSVSDPWRLFEANASGTVFKASPNLVMECLDQASHAPEPAAAIAASVAAAVLSTLDGCRPQSTFQYDAIVGNTRRPCFLAVARLVTKGRAAAVLAREVLPAGAAAAPQASVWVATPDHAVVYWSPRWHQTTGQTPGEATGTGWHCAVNPFHRKRVAKTWTAATVERRPWAVDASIWSHVHQRFRWHTIAGHPVLDAQGNLIRWVGTVEDRHDPITDVEPEATGAADRDRRVQALASRIATISGALDLLSATHGANVAVGALIARTLAPFWSDGGEPARWIVEGPSVDIRHETALSLALILQELASRAAEQGALASKDGKLTIRWHVAGARSPVHLLWQEQGPGLSAAPVMADLAVQMEAAQGRRGRIVVRPDPEAHGIGYRLDIPRDIDHLTPGAG